MHFDKITDIVCTSGSGGTAISLALASRLSGRNIKVHGVRIWGNNQNGEEILRKELEEIGLEWEKYSDILTYHDQYVGGAYGVSSPEIEELVLDSMKFTGVGLCTTYTGKTAFGMTDLMRTRPEVFQGKNVLFIHTGGVPGLWGDDNLHKAVGKVVGDGRIVKSDAYFAE